MFVEPEGIFIKFTIWGFQAEINYSPAVPLECLRACIRRVVHDIPLVMTFDTGDAGRLFIMSTANDTIAKWENRYDISDIEIVKGLSDKHLILELVRDAEKYIENWTTADQSLERSLLAEAFKDLKEGLSSWKALKGYDVEKLIKNDMTASSLAEKITEMMCEETPDYAAIEKIIQTETPELEELADIAAAITDAASDKVAGAEKKLYKSMELLLKYHLNPNMTGALGCAMWMVKDVSSPGVAGKVMQLLIEHGGDVNQTCWDYFGHNIWADNDNLMDEFYWNVNDGLYVYTERSVYDCWLVAISYGGKRARSKKAPVEMLNGNKVEMLRDFERFDFLMKENGFNEKDLREHYIKIIDKETKEVIAIW